MLHVFLTATLDRDMWAALGPR